ncbi:MAG: thiol-disulfide oxidoreductase DCC family protein [Bacteroidetes bacterium]|nr:MAG: thiol-disulfide oxidoreductase DCC family protein [Bacteroidota bacterium]
MQTQATILFDGVCNLCNASVNFVIDRDRNAYFQFGALQSDEGVELLREASYPDGYLDSILLIENGRVYRESEAALRIVRHLTGLWPLLYGFRMVPRWIRDGIYAWIARNRYQWFGRRDECRIPTPELKARFL